ncbi:ParA family protein [Moraxella osloensis]|nr:ParA family protein [Moraxella osloensis]
MKKLAISNQKGGVGKTTIAVHIALQAYKMGHRVLFIDIDTQANSSLFFEHYLENNQEQMGNAASLPTVSLFEENSDLSAFDDQRFGLLYSTNDLASVLGNPDVDIAVWANNLQKLDDKFDICVIDTPPTLAISQIAAMVVADYVLSPIELSTYSVQGAINLITTMNNIKDDYNPNLLFLGLLPSRVNKNNNRQLSILAELKNEYDHLLYPNDLMLLERQAFADTSALNLPVWEIQEHAAKKVAAKSRPVFTDIVNRMIGDKK